MEMKRLEIDNSADAAVKSGRWKNPGSSFYYKILNSFRITDESKDDEDIDKYDFDFKKVLKEAYLIAPVEKIKNTPYGITSYSQSGCKYPHHVIKDGKLVVSVPGIQAAYSRAKQQGIFKGDVKSHIEKHYKELGLDMSTMTECVDPIQEEIDLNFDFIQKHIESTLGVKFVHDDVVMESVDDIVDKEQYIKETFDWMDEILYESDDNYNRKIDEENEFDESDYSDLERIYTDCYFPISPADKKYYSMQDSMMRFFEDSSFDEIMKLYSGTEEKIDHTSYEDKNFHRTIGVDVNTGKLASVFTHGDHSEPNTVAIVFPDNTHVESVEIIPTYMPDFNTFIEAIQSKYDLRQFVTPTMSTTDELPLYEYKFDTLFKDEFIQNEFVNYIKENDVHGDVYTVKSDLPINLANTEVIDCSVNSYTFPVLSKNVPKAIAQLEKCLENANVLSRKTLGWNEYRVRKYRKSLRKLIESVKWKSLNGIAKRSNKITSIKIYPDDNVVAESVTYNRSGFNGGNTIIPFASDEFHEFMTYFEKTFNLSDFVKNGVLSYPLLFENTLVRKIFGKYFENRYLRTGEDPWKKYSSGMKYTDEYPLSEGIWDNDTLFTEDFNNTGMIKLGRLWKANSVQYQFMESMIDSMDMNPVSIMDEIMAEDDPPFDESSIDPELYAKYEAYEESYRSYRQSLLTPISDEEFIEHALFNKVRLLSVASSTEPRDEELIERYNDEIAYLVACKVDPARNKLDRDAVNWDYLNLINYDEGTTDGVDVDLLMRRVHQKVTHPNLPDLFDPCLGVLLDSYALYERSKVKPDLKYEYRIGIDTDSGKLVCVKFELTPSKINKVGNAAAHLAAYVSNHPDERNQYENLQDDLRRAYQADNKFKINAILAKLNKFMQRVEDSANSRKFINSDNKVTTIVDTLKNTIAQTGHIDYVTGSTKVIGFFYYHGNGYNTPGKKLRMLGAQSSEVADFFNSEYKNNPKLFDSFKKNSPRNYLPADSRDTFVYSIADAFSNSYIQNAFVKFVRKEGYRSEEYEIGKECGNNKYRSTKILWDNLYIYRKLNYTPVIRGKIPNREVMPAYTRDEYNKFYFKYTGLDRPIFLSKESSDTQDLGLMAEEINANIKKYEESIHNYISVSNQSEKSIETDTEEIDFEEKYSAIDATESEWNEFWSLFEQGELHKTKSQMLNYYNQYLKFIHDSSSDEIMKAHYYKEKIDEMRSDPEYDSWMRRIDLENALYAEHRLSQLKSISDEEFIDELLENKAGMLALTSSDDTELIERYQNEIAYLVECKYNPSIKLDKDTINWEYMNLIRYGTNEAVDVDALRRQTSNFIENHCSTEIIHCQDITLPYLLKSYTLYERTSTIPDVKYSYRLGIDVDTGKLVAIKFKLEPDKITKVGNAAGHVDAYLSKHPEERNQYEQLNRKLDQFKQAGNIDAAKKIERQLKEFEDKVESNANHHKFLNKDGKVTSLIDTLKNVITRTGHIDFVSGDNEIVGIIYRNGKAYTMANGKGKKVRMLPAQSKQVGEFLGRMRNYDPDLMEKFMRPNPLNYIPKNQDDDRVVSLTAAFADPKIQNLFISFVKQFNYQPEVYEIGKACGPNKYQSTRVLWNNLLLYHKLGDTPQFRGPVLDLEVKSINKFNPKTQKYDINYTGLGSPEFIKKESYESGNLNTIIADIKNNIKKYEEAVQEYISTSNQFNIDLSSYLEADDQSEENDQENQVEDDDTPPNIDLGDEEIDSDEPPTIDTDEPESIEGDTPSEDEVQEDASEAPDIIEPTSLPKATDAQEENKNGVRRKKLYIAFIEWAKSFNQKNTFGSIFDKNAFDVTYPFVPHEMRYFYRLANPILCVLSGSLTFFQVSELRKLNSNNPDMKDALIFAATENDYRVFSTRDKKVYVGVDKEDGSGIAFTKCLADSFDLYIQNMIDQGDILNGPIASESDSNNSDENNDSDQE